MTASDDHTVVDRRRIELIEPGLPIAPIEHDATGLDDDAATALVARVRASATRAAAASLDDLAVSLPEPIVSMSLRAWPLDFPEDIASRRHPPYDSRADSVMYCEVLDDLGRERGWDVHLYDAKSVESVASVILGERAEQVLYGPAAALGPPWGKDQRAALAATILVTRQAPT